MNRLELECTCNICGISFDIWNLNQIIGEEPGSGIIISKLSCPNCEISDLTLDLIRGDRSDE